jgi:hypothetical protein
VSLRLFHLVFISLSVIMATFFAAWAVQQYRVEPLAVYAVTAAGSIAAGAALAVYGAAFQRKTKNL